MIEDDNRDDDAAPPAPAEDSDRPGVRARLRQRLVDSGRAFWARRTALLAFGAGALTGILLTSLAVYGWPLPRDEGLNGDVLVVLSGQDDSVGEQRQRLIDTWNALHPDQRAEIQVLPASADAQHSEMRRRAQSARHDVDVFNLDVTWTAEFAAAEFIRPLKGVDPSGFLAKPLETCRYEGTLWALPFNTDAGLLFFRPQRLQQAYNEQDWEREADPKQHPPTWDGIRRQTDAVFAAPRPTGDRLEAGYTGQFANYEGLTVNAMEAVWEAGGQVLDDDGNIGLGSEDARRGLRALAKGFADSRIILGDARQQQESGSTQAFRDGRVLFMRNWPVAYRQLTQPSTDSDPRSAANDFDVTTLPGPSALGGQNLAVASESRHPEAARELIEFLTGEASQQVLFQDGGLASTRLRTYQDPQIQRDYPYASTLLTAIGDAELRPVTPHYWLFSQVFRRVVNQALDGDGEITDAQLRQLERALKGKGTP
jgi:multiple sugar transport system substrate-binding protein